MPKHKVPKPIVSVLTISKKERKNIISDFHVLLKQKETVKRDDTVPGQEKKKLLLELDDKITQLGGLKRYQTASLMGVTERNFDTSKWCIQHLQDSGLYKKADKDTKLKLLDAGSLTDSYRKHEAIFDVTAIDLNPRLPAVTKMDFFEMPEEEHYNVIVLSLILNFVTDPCKRAEMIMKCQRIIQPSGILFIILPRPCIDHSRYFTHDHFVTRIMSPVSSVEDYRVNIDGDKIGFELKAHHMSAKLAFYAFQQTRRPTHIPYIKRSLLNDGTDRNNFSIIVRIPPTPEPVLTTPTSTSTSNGNIDDQSAPTTNTTKKKKRKQKDKLAQQKKQKLSVS